jgi:hypothetical protein
MMTPQFDAAGQRLHVKERQPVCQRFGRFFPVKLLAADDVLAYWQQAETTELVRPIRP